MKAKDFQKVTAKRIVEVLNSGTNRVLLADEVGLGKTIVAKEVVTMLSDKNKKLNKRFNVVYICSNMSIANQNIYKLGIDRESTLNITESRLSMLHYKLKEYENDKEEQLIPLTPATSFNITNGQGTKGERSMMYIILSEIEMFKSINSKLKKFLTFEVKTEYFEYDVDKYRAKIDDCNEKSRNKYLEDLINEISQNYQGLLYELLELLYKDLEKVERKEKLRMVGQLRKMFAEISVNRLKPDLIIMDEFQRFKDLIQEDDQTEIHMITNKFLSNENTKVLLLSATPYRAFSSIEEVISDSNLDHYSDFMTVMKFLFSKSQDKGFFEVWKNYSTALTQIDLDNLTILKTHKNKAEDLLYSKISRTERFNTGIISDEFVSELEISKGDVLSFIEANEVLKEAEIHQLIPVNYVKSSAYIFSYLEGYRIKKDLYSKLEKNEIAKIVRKKKNIILNRRLINGYSKIEFGNLKLNELVKHTFIKQKLEKLLWIPASRPYYPSSGIYKETQGYSKVLVFSSWAMVPRIVSTMISYEQERRVHKVNDRYFLSRKIENAKHAKSKRRISVKLSKEYLDLLHYPCTTLADIYEPTSTIFLDKNLNEIKNIINQKLRELFNKYNIKVIEEFKRDSAPRYLEIFRFLDNDSQEIIEYISSNELEFLVELCIGSPANCALRLFGEKNSAIEISKGFTKIFNKEESIQLMNSIYSDGDYYKNVIDYCIEGNIQSMLDEYAYTLGYTRDMRNEESEKEFKIVNDICLSFIDTAILNVDMYENGTITTNKMRTHIATSYFNVKTSDKSLMRLENVRLAFNSPFRPFVLATTSVGQEGLDFHLYCRKVFHWNLPSNPIDLEQREGRVNRYQCLSIRQQVASKYKDKIEDLLIWDSMFEKATKKEKQNNSDLVPFWCREDSETKFKIERIAPLFPFSQDKIRYDKLIKAITAYRLTLGQPRQEELLAQFEGLSEQEISDLCMNLSPIKKKTIYK